MTEKYQSYHIVENGDEFTKNISNQFRLFHMKLQKYSLKSDKNSQ